METLKNPQSFQIDKTGPMLLSTHWDFYNQILISSEMDHELEANYTSPTAGLNGIKIGAKNHLKSYFSQRELQYIQESTLKLKRVYSLMEYDPMYLFSIIRNASALLRSEILSSNFQKSEKDNKKRLKESILISAEPQINSFVDWPEQFRRKTKDEVDESTLSFKEYRNEQYQFEIRTMKRPIVDLKPLPNMPNSNTLDILLTVMDIVNKDYDVRSIGKALETARDYIKSMILHSNILWEMSKFANIYQHTEPNLGLSPKEKLELLEKINKWINLIKKR
jgi:ABC-type antimicrobial peptide transport system permease subunit